MKIFYSLLIFLSSILLSEKALTAQEKKNMSSFPWESAYQKTLLKKVGDTLPKLATYPFFTYPNEGHESVLDFFPEGKVLVFGYGSLMNKASASRSMKPEALDNMYPAIAFGVKRVFNYKAKKADRWGLDQDVKERAMLNVVQTLNMAAIINGVVVEVDLEDLTKLVERETGYDLVPILVSSWHDVEGQNPELEIRIAYTFAAAHELRNHMDYTSTEFYPVRGYLHAVQEASTAYGNTFAAMWNATTFLADGTTRVNDWDEVTFSGILCIERP